MLINETIKSYHYSALQSHSFSLWSSLSLWLSYPKRAQGFQKQTDPLIVALIFLLKMKEMKYK